MADIGAAINIQTRAPGLNAVTDGLGALEAQMRKEESTIARLDSAMKRLGKGAATTKLSEASEAAKNRLAKLSEAYANASMAGTASANNLVAKQKESTIGSVLMETAMARLGSSALVSGEKLAAMGGKAKTLLLVLAAAKIVVGAIRAIGSAAINAGKSISKLSLATLERQQADRITYEGLLHSESAAMALDKRVTQLADTYGVATKDLGGYAATLVKAGVRGSDLSDILRGIAIRQAAIGDGDEALDRVVEQYKAGTINAKLFAKEQEQTFGGAAAKRGKTFEAGIDRIKRRMGELLASPAMAKGFEGVFGKIEAFLQSPAAANFAESLTNTVGGVLERMPGWIDAAASAIPALEAGFKAVAGVITGIGAALGWIAKAVGSVAKLLGAASEQTSGGGAATKDRAFDSGPASQKSAAKQSRQDAMEQLAKDSRAAGASVEQFNAIMREFNTAMNAGANVDEARAKAVAAGQALGLGLAEGIASGQGTAAAAASTMGDIVVATIKAKLQIASPSKVFARMGRYSAEGFAMGMDASAAPQASARAMVDPARLSPARAGRSITITIGDIIGVRDAGDAGELLEARIASALEAALLGAGGSA